MDAANERLDGGAMIRARGCLSPLGLGRAGGEEQVRFISGGDFAERSLSTIAEVPPRTRMSSTRAKFLAWRQDRWSSPDFSPGFVT